MDLTRLNPEQLDAATTTEGPLLIFAGAGSGKTNVLVHRIAYLIQEKEVSPFNILAITFTNKAANEMRDRIIEMIGDRGRHIWARTFHSACLQILRFEVEDTILNPNFVIYDTSDQLTIVKRILKERNIDSDFLKPSAVLGNVSSIKDKYYDVYQGIEDYRAEGRLPELTLEVIEEYQRTLLANNAADFDDLLCYTVKLFRDHPDILERYQDRFKYIMVDEYQDTNKIQYELVHLLAEKYRNVCVVGDDDQSIYEWRGADISNILSFEKDYPEAKVVKLEKNYRSTKTILNLANGVVANNTVRKKKRLWTENAVGEKVVYYEADDDREEAQYIVDQIEDLMKRNNYEYKDFAVLIRTNAQFRSIEEGFLQNGIPYRVYGGVKFFQRREIKDILAYLYVIANPNDAVNMQRVINIPKCGIGAQTWQKILSHHTEHPEMTLLDSLSASSLKVSSKVKKALASFTELISDAKEIAEDHPMEELVNFVIRESGYISYLYDRDPYGAEADEENLNELLSIAASYDQDELEDDKRSLAGFLEGIALYTDLDQDKNADEEENDKVSIMTMHSSKGLEFPVVFVAGFEVDLFPHSLAKKEEYGMEEERRLCYVAFTRAKERLFVTGARQRMLRGQFFMKEPSEFLAEMDDRYYVDKTENRKLFNDVFSSKKSFEPAREKKKLEEVGLFSAGDKVYHNSWGEGTVVNVDPQDPACVTVVFPTQGLKVLDVRYAPIKRD